MRARRTVRVTSESPRRGEHTGGSSVTTVTSESAQLRQVHGVNTKWSVYSKCKPCLCDQVKPYNVYVTVAYPPDTDTPGLAEENKTKVSTPT